MKYEIDYYYSLDESLQKIETHHFLAEGIVVALLFHHLLIFSLPYALSCSKKDIL